MQELTDEDRYWIQERIPTVLWKLMVANKGSLFIAGGFIRSCISREPIMDIDCFSPSKDAACKMALAIASANDKLRMIETENAFTVLGEVWPIQFIHRWTFTDPRKCIESFDFTIARAAVWISSDPEDQRTDDSRHLILHTCCDDRFYADLASKRLVYMQPIRNEDPGGSLLRLLKFYKRGYHAPLRSIANVMARMVYAKEAAEAMLRQEYIDDKKRSDREEYIADFLAAQLHEVDPEIQHNR